MARATPEPSSREKVELAYGSKLPDATWRYLEEKDWVSELEGGFATVDDVVMHLREINASAPAAVVRQSRRVRGRAGDDRLFEGINDRMTAISEILALRASRDLKVMRFRSHYLPDGHVAANRVSAWIEEVYARELPASWPSEPGPREASNNVVAFFGWPHPYSTLEWIDDSEPTVKLWCVPPRSCLGELAEAGNKLATTWDWSRAQATAFVLTGETPPRPGVRRISTHTQRGFDDRYGTYQYGSVRATIDLEVTPEELAGWWRGVREDAGISGRKPIGAKSVALARFALSRDDSTTFEEDMHAWNSTVSQEWQFTDRRNYRSAAKKAIDAVNEPARGVRW
jgi:hypothetical protein